MFDKKKVRYTPAGIAVYPKLIKPDTKYKKTGEFSTKLKFADPAVEAAFIEMLKPLLDEAHAEVCREQKKKTIKKAECWKPEIEVIKDDEGNVVEEKPTGKMLFNFKLPAEIKTKEGEIIHLKPSLYDAKGKLVPDPSGLNIGGGSTIKVGFTCRPYYTAKDNIAGLTLQIKGVQIINLVEYNGGGCSFGAEAGGFDASSVSEPSGPPSAGSDEAPDAADAEF